MLIRLLDLIDALQYVNFLAIAILELFGVAVFFLFRNALQIRRNFFWGLVAIFVFVVGWRELLEIPGRRYYVMSILASLPFALIPVMVDWNKVNWKPHWKLFGRYFLLIGTIVVMTISIGRNFKPRKILPLVAEFGTAICESYHRTPAAGTILLLDSTTRGRQFTEEAGLEWEFCWVPTYKEEHKLGSAISHIRNYLLMQNHIPSNPEILFFCRTTNREEWKKLQDDFKKFNYKVIDQAESRQRPGYFWVRFQRKSK